MVGSAHDYKAYKAPDAAIARASEPIRKEDGPAVAPEKVALFVPVNYRDGQDKGRQGQREQAKAVINGFANLDPKDVGAVAGRLQTQAMFSGNSPVAYYRGNVAYEDPTLSSQNRLYEGFANGHQVPGTNVPLGAAELHPNYPTKPVPPGFNTKATGKEFVFAPFGSAPFSLKKARTAGNEVGSFVVASADFYKPATVTMMAPRISTALAELSAVQGLSA